MDSPLLLGVLQNKVSLLRMSSIIFAAVDRKKGIGFGEMDGEVDPAAAFLAREQDELADIAEDTLGFTSPTIEVMKNTPFSLCTYDPTFKHSNQPLTTEEIICLALW